MAWKDGQVTAYRLTAKQAQEAQVVVNGETKPVKVEKE